MTIVSRPGKLILAALVRDRVTEVAFWGKLRTLPTIHHFGRHHLDYCVAPTWLIVRQHGSLLGPRFDRIGGMYMCRLWVC